MSVRMGLFVSYTSEVTTALNNCGRMSRERPTVLIEKRLNMYRQGLILIVILGLGSFVSTARAELREDVNFAFGGATTNNANALDTFALQQPTIADWLSGIREKGLDVIGLKQQLDFAVATINDVDGERDLFWVYAGFNNYLAGEQNPSVAPAEIGNALRRLYQELGARRFVVPGLYAVGDIPLFAAAPQSTKDYLNWLTGEHNRILNEEVVEFLAEYRDASVIFVDVYSVLEAYKNGSEFTEVTIGCDMALPPEKLAQPDACAGFLYLDIVHASSAAWRPVAQAVSDALVGTEVDRIITLGDSFSDLGSLSDTFERAVGFAFPFAPFTQGRFTEAENVVQQVEQLIGVLQPSSPFSQPLISSGTYTRSARIADLGSVYIPKQLKGDAKRDNASVFLVLRTDHCPVHCSYQYDGEGTFGLKWCSGGVSGGDLVDAKGVIVMPLPHVTSVTIDWLHYSAQ